MIFYDCYDKNKKFLGQWFEEDCKALLQHHLDVVFVLGLDYATRRAKWMLVSENGVSFAGWRD